MLYFFPISSVFPKAVIKFLSFFFSPPSIGIRSIILPGVRVGNHCVIGAGSVVTKDIPDHSIAAGNPAKVIRGEISVINGKIVDGC